MSVLIKGMEMPKRCSECFFAKLSSTGESLICDRILSRVPWDERPFDCPLIEVPEPHGRLIDEKDIVPKDGYIIADGMACIPVKDIANAPTAIPASEEG